MPTADIRPEARSGTSVGSGPGTPCDIELAAGPQWYRSPMTMLHGFTLLLALQLLGEVLSRVLALPVPGPVVGLLLLLLALIAIPPVRALVEPAANALLSHLSLLFIPAGVGVLVHIGRLDGALLGVALTLSLSTLIGLCTTAWTLQRLMRGRPTRHDQARTGIR